MIVTIMFKTPDVLEYLALEDVSEEELEEVKEKLSKWIKYKECITIKFDTDEMTAKVLEIQ